MTKLIGVAGIAAAIVILAVLCLSSTTMTVIIAGTTLGTVLLDMTGDRRPDATAGRSRPRKK